MQISCDALGRVAATIDELTNETTYAYDAMNRVAAITNALGDATIYEYDHRGNKTYEGGATYPVRYTYDIYGNKTTMTTYRHEPDGGVGHADNGRCADGRHDTGRHDGRARCPHRAAGRHDDVAL